MPSDNKTVISSPRHRSVKRFTDILVSLAGLVMLSPLILYVAIRVWFSSKGPVMYLQERVGYQGKIFRIKKFRSMYEQAEVSGPQLSVDGDTRITPWGRIMRRWKLDELPQLWNVLTGDMSIVGPRPERAYYIRQLEQLGHVYAPLLQFRPGLTSLGMVKFGYARNVHEMVRRMQYDLIYLENNSMKMDLKIMVGTLRTIFVDKVH